MGDFQIVASCQKKIRAAHAKDKQQIQSTCGYPNRLNLPQLTAAFSGPFENFSGFYEKILAFCFSYRPSSAWTVAACLAASSRTSCKSDLNSHFSRAAMSPR